jgi:rhodanese-related sulfurtransferase
MAKTLKDMMAEANAAVPRITPAEAAALVEEGALVVDVRDAPEVAAGMVPGAVNVSRGLLEFKADPSSPSRDPAFDTERPVILYCASGGRSALGGKVLKDLGYSRVYNLGGVKEWEVEGLTPATVLGPRKG